MKRWLPSINMDLTVNSTESLLDVHSSCQFGRFEEIKQIKCQRSANDTLLSRRVLDKHSSVSPIPDKLKIDSVNIVPCELRNPLMMDQTRIMYSDWWKIDTDDANEVKNTMFTTKKSETKLENKDTTNQTIFEGWFESGYQNVTDNGISDPTIVVTMNTKENDEPDVVLLHIADDVPDICIHPKDLGSSFKPLLLDSPLPPSSLTSSPTSSPPSPLSSSSSSISSISSCASISTISVSGTDEFRHSKNKDSKATIREKRAKLSRQNWKLPQPFAIKKMADIFRLMYCVGTKPRKKGPPEKRYLSVSECEPSETREMVYKFWELEYKDNPTIVPQSIQAKMKNGNRRIQTKKLNKISMITQATLKD
jgi:hypothetical protein